MTRRLKDLLLSDKTEIFVVLLDTIRLGLDECKTKVDRLTIGRPPSDAYGASTLVFQVSCCIL